MGEGWDCLLFDSPEGGGYSDPDLSPLLWAIGFLVFMSLVAIAMSI